MLGKTSISDLSEHVFDLILELYNIDSHLLLSVLPQLEFKLKVSIFRSSSLFETCAFTIITTFVLIWSFFFFFFACF